nr:unnamed protein product [Digitaria exilis]
MDVEGPGDNRDRLPGVVAMGHHFKPCPCNVLDDKRPRSRVLAEPAKVDHGQWRPRRRRLPQLHSLARHGSSPTAHAEQNKCALPNACSSSKCRRRLLRVEDWVQEQATQQPQAGRSLRFLSLGLGSGHQLEFFVWLMRTRSDNALFFRLRIHGKLERQPGLRILLRWSWTVAGRMNLARGCTEAGGAHTVRATCCRHRYPPKYTFFSVDKTEEDHGMFFSACGVSS